MFRVLAPRSVVAGAAVLLLAACSSGSSGNASSSSSASSAPSASAPVSASASGSAASGPMKIVSQGLKKDGAQVILDAAANGKAVFASVLSQTAADDYDAGLAYSTDAGSSWKYGGFVADRGLTFPEGIAATSNGAIIVGTNEVQDSSKSIVSQAFIALAAAPDYTLVAIPTPKEFQGENVHLQDVAVVSDVILVVGWEQGKPDAQGNAPRTSYLWRSTDGAKTWSRAKITVPGSSDNSLEQIVFAPDGSWNLIGQAVFGDGANQYDPLWLQSVDAGATFQLKNQDVFSAPLDQGATRIEFAGDGSAAVLGWDEVKDGNASRASALWVSGPDQKLKRIGTTEVPVAGGTPPGEFINGLLWDNTKLAAWGTATGAYPMDNVQFWGLVNDQLTQSSMLPGNGTPLAISKILVGKDDALAFGFTGKDLASADATVWKGASLQ